MEQNLLYTNRLTQSLISLLITKFFTPLLGSSINDAYVAYDQLNRPYVLSRLTQKEQRFFEMTQDNIGKKIAVVLDGKVKSAPTVQDQIFGERFYNRKLYF